MKVRLEMKFVKLRNSVDLINLPGSGSGSERMREAKARLISLQKSKDRKH